jgi:hypothetical protein
MTTQLTDAILQALADSQNDYRLAVRLLRKRCNTDQAMLLAVAQPWLNATLGAMVSKIGQTYGLKDEGKTSVSEGKTGEKTAAAARPTAPDGASPQLSNAQLNKLLGLMGGAKPEQPKADATAAAINPATVLSQLAKPAPTSQAQLDQEAAKRQQQTWNQVAAAFKS